MDASKSLSCENNNSSLFSAVPDSRSNMYQNKDSNLISEANLNPQVSKATPEGQYKKGNDKGKGMKPLGKGKKNVARPITSAATPAGPSVNL